MGEEDGGANAHAAAAATTASPPQQQQQQPSQQADPEVFELVGFLGDATRADVSRFLFLFFAKRGRGV
jgi:hypothetical protein